MAVAKEATKHDGKEIFYLCMYVRLHEFLGEIFTLLSIYFNKMSLLMLSARGRFSWQTLSQHDIRKI